MIKEIHDLEENKTWTLVHLLLGKKAMNCKWAYKAKYKSKGPTERFKAELVVRGNNQLERF